MFKKLLFALFFCTLPTQLLPTIVERNYLSSVLEFLPDGDCKNVLIMFDIDNNIAIPETEIGSDQWFYYQWNKKQEQGHSKEDALQYVLPLYYQIRNKVNLQLTEPGIPSLIAHLQSHGAQVIGLTAQGYLLTHKTISELRRLGIDFGPTAFFDHYLKNFHHQCAHGIIFCHGNPKGPALLDVMDKFDYKPDLIIFTDDKLKNLEMVKEAAESRNIQFVGIRYSGCDEQVANFDTHAADLELAAFDAACEIKLYS